MPVDLVVLAPSTDERRDPRWIQRAVHTATSRLSQAGMVYVIPSRAMGLRRALGSAGLRLAGTLLHIPDLARSRYVVPVGTAAERYALSGQLAMRGLKRRTAGVALRAPWLSTLGPTGSIVRRDPATPLADWLFELEGSPSPRPAGSVLVTAGGTAAGGSIVHRFAGNEAVPDAVAKISPRANEEAHALLTIAPDAERAGARVPNVLCSGELGSVPFVLQSTLKGRSAARLLEEELVTAHNVQERITTWLERWGRSSSRPRELGPQDLERRVLSPASELVPLAADHGRYLDYLKALCSRAIGRTCPFVSSHGDLTVANIVLHADAELGIVDWEEASADSLPLTDFFYAVADAIAATHGYVDRPRAVASCFAADGDDAALIDGLQQRLSGALGADEVVQEVCFHACWLHHAANEAGRSAHPDAGPFVTILQMIARAPERFRALAR